MAVNPIQQEIKRIVQELKLHYKISMRQISRDMKHNDNYVSVEMAKGTNKKLLNDLKDYQAKIIAANTNPLPEMLALIRAMKADMDKVKVDVAEIKERLKK